MKIADYNANKDNDSRCFSFSNIEKKGLYKAIFSRRDVRSHFIKDKNIPNDVLLRILNAGASCSVSWFFSAVEFYIN